MHPKLELTKNWLLKAFRDLESAEKLAGGTNPFLDTGIYHCQQAAEKAIKAYLIYSEQDFEKTHNIIRLLELAVKFSDEFKKLENEGILLTPYATEFRYPEEIYLEPDRKEYNEAYLSAKKIFDTIVSILPKEIHPTV
ncbi:MAG: HEPN domain-containing protein [Spirochaetia bacterium]|nr:HEPN domain-containing protein [Spirochaetia bacterium]